MSEDITRPGVSLAAVTKSNTVDIPRVGSEYPRALWVGGAGDVDVVTPDGLNAVLSAVPAGTLLPIRCKRVNSTATTATLIVAIY